MRHAIAKGFMPCWDWCASYLAASACVFICCVASCRSTDASHQENLLMVYDKSGFVGRPSLDATPSMGLTRAWPMSSPGAKVVGQRNMSKNESESQHRVTGCDVQDSCNRTMIHQRVTRLQTLPELPELELEVEQEMAAATEQQQMEMRQLLRNSWTLSATNTSKIWLLRTGNTS